MVATQSTPYDVPRTEANECGADLTPARACGIMPVHRETQGRHRVRDGYPLQTLNRVTSLAALVVWRGASERPHFQRTPADGGRVA